METLTCKSDLERLPVELKMMIMQKLTKQDLCNVALVSKNLNSVALDPSLWTQLTITIFHTIPDPLIKKRIHSPRFKKIKLLKIVDSENGTKGSISKRISAILKKTINVKTLVELDLCETPLLGVPAKLLRKTVSNLRKVDLSGTQLSTKKLVAICEETIKSNSLTDLTLSANRLQDVPTKLLSKAVSKLEKATLYDTYLSTEQAVAILEETIESNSLTELNIGINNLENVPAKVLGKAISKLEKTDLVCADLSNQQITAILEETIKSHSLTQLCLAGNYLKDVPAKVLNKAISKLEKADLYHTNLSTEQLVAIFEETIKSNSLTELRLTSNAMSDVPAGILSKAISKLEKADLDDTGLSTEQVVAIFEETFKSNSLTELILKNNAMNNVPAGVLSKAISKLEKADLDGTGLSTEQVVAILEETIKSNSLTELILKNNSMNDVPAGILSKAISKLKKADLDGTDLSTEQVVAIFEETFKSNSHIEMNIDCSKLNLKDVPAKVLSKAISKLKEEQVVAIFEKTFKLNSLIGLNIDCSKLNLKDVPAKVLGKGISKLKSADLDNTVLSTEQVVAILEETLQSNSLIELTLSYKNLKDVPAKFLSKAISTLESVSLNGTDLSTEQVVAILEETIKSNLLTELSLSSNDLKDVPAGVLSKAVSKLERAFLGDTNLSTEQLVAILEETVTSKSLILLSLDGNNFEHIPPQLLSKAISKLKWADGYGEFVEALEEALGKALGEVQKKTPIHWSALEF